MTDDPVTERSPRLHNLQVLRFLAATLVVIAHALLVVDPDAAGPLGSALVSFGDDGVFVFFVISGFVMVHATRGEFGRPGAVARFASRRLIRIVPLYWLVSAVALLVSHVGSGGVCGRAGLADFAASLAFVPRARCDGLLQPILSQGWTLNYEMFFYACFAAALSVRRGPGLASVAVVLIGLSAVGFGIGGIGHIERSGDPTLFYLSPVQLYFLAGVALGLGFEVYARRTAPRVHPLALLAGAVACFLLLPFRNGLVPDGAWVVREGMVALVVCAIVALATLPTADRLGPVQETLELLGDASYSTYLMHIFALVFVHKVANAVGPGASPAAFVLAGTVAALVAGVAVHLCVEKPLLRRLRRRLVPGAGWRRPAPGTVERAGAERA